MPTLPLLRRGLRRADPPPLVAPPAVVLAASLLLSVSWAARAAALPTVDGDDDPRRTDAADAFSDPWDHTHRTTGMGKKA